MKLGIVILHWRNVEQTRELLDKLQTWDKLKPTILLVQNEATKDAFPDITESNIIKSYSKENLGFGGGCNLGIKASMNQNLDCTLLLNTDAEIAEEELEKLVNHLKANPNIFSIGPKLIESANGKEHIYVGGRNIAKNMATRLQLNEIGENDGKSVVVDYTIGAIILLNNAHLDEVGLFDMDYFFSGEVADLCHRAQSKGFEVVTLLEATGYHRTESSDLRESMYKYYSLRNRFLFIRKHNLSSAYRNKWYKLVFKEFLHGIWIRDKVKARTMFYTLWDVTTGKMGNRNDLFL